MAMKRSGRRRTRRMVSVSADTALARSSDSTFAEIVGGAGLAALAYPITMQYITQHGYFSKYDSKNVALAVGGVAFVAGLWLHDTMPTIGIGLAVAGIAFGLLPYVTQWTASLTAPSTTQLPAPAPTPQVSPPATT